MYNSQPTPQNFFVGIYTKFVQRFYYQYMYNVYVLVAFFWEKPFFLLQFINGESERMQLKLKKETARIEKEKRKTWK